MKKKDIKSWLFASACLVMMTTATACSEDKHPDQAIPTVTPQTPTEFSEQVLWPSNLTRVSVHDPSVVWEPSSWSYYIFGSHRAAAKSPNMMTWSTVDVPWAADGVVGVGNDKAFVKPEVTAVPKGGTTVSLPEFNAYEWSKKGSANYNIDGNMWAPDVIYNKEMKKWCMYLSINGDAWYSSIIMLTSSSIVGPYTYQAPVVISGFYAGENYKETDLEVAIGAQAELPSRYATGDRWGNRYPNCIDPCVFYDEEGKLWMSYGSWSGGIWMLKLNEATGLRDYDVVYAQTGSGDDIVVDPYFGKKIAGGHYVSGEASYIEHIGDYYYLFMSYGGLAAGGDPDDYNNGGYQMRVFRSQSVDGPYVDSKGSSAVFNSYRLNFGPSENDGNTGVNIFGAYGEWGYQTVGAWSERSQGHNSVIAAEDGRTYLVYHTRFQDQGENHQVRVHQLFQNEDAWLVAAPFEYTGEIAKSAQTATQQIIPTSQIAGAYKLLVHNYKLDHTKKELSTPVGIMLHADGTITGSGYTGRWTVREGTSYITINIGQEYKGVMILQTLEPKNEQVPCFTCLNSQTGVTIWGYKMNMTGE
ncbi:MAG: glycoside hydrolase family 43 protein [Prevotella sp.]|nr:glycoside hydrolase family 43 protein [Prevotella sp.]